MIDIGNPAINRSTHHSFGNTFIDKNNPANLTGRITSVKIWAETTMTGVKVAIFTQGEANVFTARDSEAVSDITAGSEVTRTVNLDVVEGDFIGIYWVAGRIELDTSGNGDWVLAGDQTSCSEETFTFTGNRSNSLYGTGALIKMLSGAFGLVGVVGKLPKISLLGVFNSTGSVSTTKKVFKAISGVFDLIGDVSSAITFTKVLSGVLTFTPSLTVMIYYYWGKITKAISVCSKVDKGVDTYNKVDKDVSDWNKDGK